MSGLGRFMRLEAATVRAVFKGANLWIGPAMAILVAVATDAPAATVAVGALLPASFAGTPFGLTARNNLDGLYATLGIPRRVVVVGRFAFFALFAAASVVVVVSFAAAATFWKGLSWESLGAAALAAYLAACLITFIELGIYFKFGYAKGRFAATAAVGVVFGLIAALYYASLNRDLADWFYEAAVRLTVEPGLALAAACVLVALIGAGAFWLALASYRRRDF
ncbi:MAG: ABC-2 transporter permease [Bifidobacteriaceae bacterium]|jgi:hypothetical protein|nr:ABC-2 transporter permease [Bifidobacteriaceae bacterium]